MLVSVHIPKTGGTNLTREIRRGAMGRYLLDYGDRPSMVGLDYEVRRFLGRLRIVLTKQNLLRDYDVIHGHFVADKYRSLLPLASFIVFLREPVERTVSHYAYWKYQANRTGVNRRSALQQSVQSGAMSLAEFAEHPVPRHIYRRFLGSMQLVDFAFVGLLERYEQSIEMLNRMFGLQVQARHERRGSKERVSAAELAAARRTLERCNAENLEIYEQAKRIFRDQCKRFGMHCDL